MNGCARPGALSTPVSAVEASVVAGWIEELDGNAAPGPGWRARARPPASPSQRRVPPRRPRSPTKYAGEYPIDFHATRRSFASWLEANEVPTDIVDRLLGQAGKSVRKRHYSATDLEVMRKAIETIRLDLQTVAFAALIAAPVQQPSGIPL